jgi:hypothetical protein
MPTFSFSGHETFPLRYGWLRKGVQAVKGDPAFFSDAAAMVRLGVGKNMVDSIRHWCIVSGLLRQERDGARTLLQPSILGSSYFLNDGIDPHLEFESTLWLVHWQIASNESRCTTWYWMFNRWHAVEFTKGQVLSEITAWVEKNSEKRISENTLKRDVEVFVRTYTTARPSGVSFAEESLDCPLAELNLIREMEDGRTFQFRRGDHRGLSQDVFAYALLDFWSSLNTSANSLSIERILYDAGSPGKVFKLDEDAVVRRIEELSVCEDIPFWYDETAGMKQIFRIEQTDAQAWLVKRYQYASQQPQP